MKIYNSKRYDARYVLVDCPEGKPCAKCHFHEFGVCIAPDDMGLNIPEDCAKAYFLKAEPYYPSNGTEGEGFMEIFCASCKKDTGYRKADGKTLCGIIAYAMGQGKAPKQWIRVGCKSICTSFVDYKTYKPKTRRSRKGQLQLL